MLAYQDPLISKPLAPLPTDPQLWMGQLSTTTTTSFLQILCSRAKSKDPVHPQTKSTLTYFLAAQESKSTSLEVICREFVPFLQFRSLYACTQLKHTPKKTLEELPRPVGQTLTNLF